MEALQTASTGVAAINIYGTAINTGIGIPNINVINIAKLSDKLRAVFQHKHSELKSIKFNEISMVSNVRSFVKDLALVMMYH